MNIISRRQLLYKSLFGYGALGFKSMILGVPISFLRSQALGNTINKETFLIYSFDRDGSPINNNCPGSYLANSDFIRPKDFQEGVVVKLDKESFKAASPWNDLNDSIKNRLHFIHHQTGANAHFEEAQVLTSYSNIVSSSGVGAEMLPSAINQMLTTLEVSTSNPIALGGIWNMTHEGTPINKQKPQFIADRFTPLIENEKKLQKFRDEAVDKIYHDVCTRGTNEQKKFCNEYLKSIDQARKLVDELGTLISDMTIDDSNKTNLSFAAALIASSATRVVGIEIPFGGDNHEDDSLSQEKDGLINGIEELSHLWEKMETYGIQDKTTVALQGVFGRTFNSKGKGKSSGRDHNSKSAVTVLFGPHVKAGVSGGLKEVSGQVGAEATAISSTNGNSKDNADIPPEETLDAACKTIARACGISVDSIDKRFRSGKIINSVLTT